MSETWKLACEYVTTKNMISWIVINWHFNTWITVHLTAAGQLLPLLFSALVTTLQESQKLLLLPIAMIQPCSQL